MNNLVIYKSSSLYDILKEISSDFNFKIEFIDEENKLNVKLKTLKNYLILSNKKYLDINDLIVLYDLPMNIFKLVEKINTEFLKLQYSKQSKIRLNDYIVDLNSREISSKTNKVKLTEKEIDTIMYLLNANKPVAIDELQKKIWNYQNEIESHTVETHIYRLRKKFLDIFNDNKFIISEKNGYKIE
ncbi:winged helix-turn-helix domain-containing protein [Candidatus Pelagibacter sp. HIMB1321]|uniref:winged helix-turn-helix domain-containing protein n=1 Tax=Candidatus Pelagibacter sp. HIMB1321 TaxID=1388755 RepID=UPI000A07F1C9|nr:winged helix-turn-helix domain-containing protein [Candidatus Pelagibacter sp. HIMB1321]SMF80543.1 Response regulators consisting of a CheY-like receiver domain and a winged-helix DNA-binding domain [Candidatus Pelagibacter sp. HIMB1321]